MEELIIPTRKPRRFLGEDFDLSGWKSLKGFYEDLVSRELSSGKDLKDWFKDRDELESFLSENMAWRYIEMTCDTKSEEAQKNYQYFVTEIQPELAVYDDKLNKKVLENPFLNELTEAGYDITLRGMKKAVEIFREGNIPIVTKIQTKTAEYQAATGSMTVTIDGEEMTLQKAGSFLTVTDRKKREEAWTKIAERRSADIEKFDILFNELKMLRHQVALNADFKNYRDYAFASLGRFDYTPEDCFDFHESVAEAIVPLLNTAAKERKSKLNCDSYRPWDGKVDVSGKQGLKPFENGEDLLDKTVVCFDKIDKTLGDYIRIMRRMGHFDVESRMGKAPGGYNYPLMEIGVPFIFMNATSTLRDVVTMVHEGGHATHSFETRPLALSTFKNTTAEVAEVASM
ncbi:MAG: oligoendopeptidase F, partial [Psychromonas sp.]